MTSSGMASKLKGFLSLAAILSVVGGGVWLCDIYTPKLIGLKEKDPEIFDQIVRETRKLHLIEARRLLIKLDTMTPNEVYWHQYRNWKEKWSDNPEFQQQALKDRLERWETEGAEKKKAFDEQVGIVEDAREMESSKHLAGTWNRMSPWEKGLVLREKCLEMFGEKMNNSLLNRRFKNIHKASSRLSGKEALYRADFCENAIPLGHDETIVLKALENLKRDMNYFNFTRILSSVGIPHEHLFSYSGQLRKMTGSLGGA